MTIKEIRALTGLTQKQFAEKYHITFSSIRNWESGHRTCPDYVAELLEFKVREDLKMDRQKVAEQIQFINSLSEEEQKYLYGECDSWCLENFEEGLQIVAIMESDNHENGIAHSYLRNAENGLCYDVRGESGCDEEIVAYTGIDCFSRNTEKYVFYNKDDFKKFLKWIEFEVVRLDYLD